MRVNLRVTDSDGTIYEGEADLAVAAASGEAKPRGTTAKPRATVRSGDAGPSGKDFSLPVRAFMNRHAKGRSGHQAFTLLVARLAGGEVGAEVRVEDVKTEWSRMTGLLGGGYAPVYGTRAKNNAWVDSPRRGVFALLPDWTQVVRE